LLLLFLVPRFFYSPIVRATVPVGCIVLMVAQWVAYRKAHTGAHLAFLSLAVAGFSLANLRLALTAAWIYTWNGDLTRTQILMMRTQHALGWMVAAIVAVAPVWGLFSFVRWGQKRMAAARR
jgi:hypothetical protein